MCLGIVLTGLLRQPPELIPLLYLILLASLTGQMIPAGRQIRQEASAHAHYANLALTGLLRRRALYETLQGHDSGHPGTNRGA